MKTIAIKPELLVVLRPFIAKPFTVDQLTTAYLESATCKHSNKKPARQFVYRNMVRMMKADLMLREINKGGWPTYTLSEKFKKITDSKDITEKKELVTVDAPSIAPTAHQKSSTSEAIKDLSNRLSQHKSDMLCAVGEAEEYDALCAAHPSLKSQIQDLYNHARERSAILLGKIKALETLMSLEAPERC
ncbi:hypothetical protein SAMN02745866_00496 [Alteromonadaceae bacterium Bs31]|nr:hypothetical protein SAMN02745866_00496 [Alteromonadaceae bacterium Bs31]